VTSRNTPPKFLSSDGIILENPIDFDQLVHDLRRDRIPSSSLDSKGYLLSGMLNSDGIILFDNKGRLLGYNCFIKLGSKDKSTGSGGARKRAFAALKGKIGKGVCAAFMQSQDGWSDWSDSNE